MTETASGRPDHTRRRLLLTLPLAGAAAAGGACLVLLNRMRGGTYDPHAVSDPLIGHPVPQFSLPAQPPGTAGFSSADVMAAGHPLLINFFASWCIPCLQEAPTLMSLQAENAIPIWGVAYEDRPEAAAGFLARNGNPYTCLARDASGTTAIDFGLYGVPETYFVDRTGIIRHRWAGPLTDDAMVRGLLAAWA
jgi:cytochrome c biogenesis protein CcmG/thiol:disulfide interchange protein DsbE